MPDADVRRALRDAYDARAEDRDARSAPAWETRERDAFSERLRREGRRSLLELGAGTGADATVFLADGLDVVCVDLSPEMVRRCEAKGLTARVMDVCRLDFPSESFDAVYAMNCLVHTPKSELPQVLVGISRVLKPGGLAYFGLYGGRELEGVWNDDPYEPKRFFSHRGDVALLRSVSAVFALRSFKRILRGWNGLHFQSLVVAKTAGRRGRT